MSRIYKIEALEFRLESEQTLYADAGPAYGGLPKRNNDVKKCYNTTVTYRQRAVHSREE